MSNEEYADKWYSEKGLSSLFKKKKKATQGIKYKDSYEIPLRGDYVPVLRDSDPHYATTYQCCNLRNDYNEDEEDEREYSKREDLLKNLSSDDLDFIENYMLNKKVENHINKLDERYMNLQKAKSSILSPVKSNTTEGFFNNVNNKAQDLAQNIKFSRDLGNVVNKEYRDLRAKRYKYETGN